MLRADLHIHTAYSMDCAMTLQQVIDRCLKIGINCLAITDHGTTKGARELKEMAPFPVIIGEEILTPHGEIMGLFLKDTIPSPLSVKEAVAQIKAQKGLVCIPHPYDRSRLSTIKDGVLEQILANIDIIEVFNSRCPFSRASARAWQLAQKHGLLVSAGSDAHTASEIGAAYVEMPEFNNKEEFLSSLAKGKIFGRKSSPLVHLVSTTIQVKKRLIKVSLER